MREGAAKWPREYAAEICAAKTVERRRALLAAVPDNFRAWVEKLVRMHWERK